MGPTTTSSKRIRRVWADPFVIGAIVLAVAALAVSSYYGGSWLENLLLYAGILVSSVLVWLLTRKRALPPLSIPHPSREAWAVFGWYAVFMAVALITKGDVPLGNEFGKWLWFIIVPVLLIFAVGGRGRGFKELLRSVVPVRPGFGNALLLGLAAWAVIIPLVILTMPPEQMDKLREIFQSPARAALALPLSFLFGAITVAATEEIFFRGILQSRLAVVMKSEIRACLVVTVLFGLYHLPYAYFMAEWPPHGNIAWALSSVIAEQAATGFLLGLLWLRTRNIAAPMMLHILVDMIPIMTSLSFGPG